MFEVTQLIFSYFTWFSLHELDLELFNQSLRFLDANWLQIVLPFLCDQLPLAFSFLKFLLKDVESDQGQVCCFHVLQIEFCQLSLYIGIKNLLTFKELAENRLCGSLPVPTVMLLLNHILEWRHWWSNLLGLHCWLNEFLHHPRSFSWSCSRTWSSFFIITVIPKVNKLHSFNLINEYLLVFMVKYFDTILKVLRISKKHFT